MNDQTILRMPFRRVPLWGPEQGGRWGTPQLNQHRLAHKRSFQRGMQQLSMTDEELTFPSFGSCFNYGVSLADAWRSVWPWTVGGVDPGSEARPGTVLFVLGLDPQYRRIPRFVHFMHGSGPNLVNKMYELYTTYGIMMWMVEDNGIQDSIIQWANHMHKAMPVMAFTTTANKRDPEMGLPVLDVEFSQNSWLIPWKDKVKAGHEPQTEEQKHWQLWQEEMSMHPGHATTDSVMATWFAQQAARFLEVGKKEDTGTQTEEEITTDEMEEEYDDQLPNLGDY